MMTAALRLRGEERVLEVGTGSGYQVAVLAELAREVYTLERLPQLARAAEERLRALGYDRVQVVVGDGSLGWPAAAPYDAIVVTAATPRVFPAWLEQLRDGGRLVVPVGQRVSQELKRFTKHGNETREENLGPCVFVPLIAEEEFPPPGPSDPRANNARRPE